MNLSAAPVTIGDLLLRRPDNSGAGLADWMVEVLNKLPDAWLVKHPQNVVRQVPESGCHVVTFLAPTETDIRELAEAVAAAPTIEQSVLANGPQIFTLREAAAALIAKGFGATIVPYTPDAANEDGVLFTAGDLVKLVVDGVLSASPSAHEWAGFVESKDEPHTPFSDFLVDANGAPEKLQLVRPPENVIPEALWPALNETLENYYPELQPPALARNSRGQIALIFFSKIGHTVTRASQNLARLNWLLPSHYHVLVVPRE